MRAFARTMSRSRRSCSGCICQGFVDAGGGYFDRMSGEFDVMPQMEHYECMIELFGRHGRMGELEEFVNRMLFDPTVPMWTLVFDCCREYGDSRLGEWAAKRLKESNPGGSLLSWMAGIIRIDTHAEITQTKFVFHNGYYTFNNKSTVVFKLVLS
ncbi:Pentatricopeptide repeat-containing protein [Acorus gramineus]|uniref:Pentatricopeptide repeat-containing protein n=1 Tax=Acorus gramineus TaxID=55184 RepID=A0AAV9AML2_ACOGR|nr:Pentatricopeptide repeat-containing protein [Acorus gramineus]